LNTFFIFNVQPSPSLFYCAYFTEQSWVHRLVDATFIAYVCLRMMFYHEEWCLLGCYAVKTSNLTCFIMFCSVLWVLNVISYMNIHAFYIIHKMQNTTA
jgi:hypothetical protein